MIYYKNSTKDNQTFLSLHIFHKYQKYIEYYYTKELNTRKIFPNLCESCATKLDEALKYARGEWIKQLNISSRNAEINKERREKLGTKG